MNNPETSTPDYTMGFSDEMLEVLRRDTAEKNAAFLLPYLRPGLRVLDFGCGPGTISVGLARAVDPGELHGVDMSEASIQHAHSVAEVSRVTNAFFQVGDVADLPFEDGFFDVAFCNGVLLHIPDTLTALSEVRRVLKPGGIFGCREIICASSFAHPDFDVLHNAWGMFSDLLAADDAHPQIGMQLKRHLRSAGFENVRMTVGADTYSSPADIEYIYWVVTKWFLSPEVTEAAIQYGASTRELCDRIGETYKVWREDPGAFFFVAQGEAVANKP